MKVTLLPENLKNQLTFVNHAISSRSDLPVLLHILLEAHEGSLTLKSTDLEIGIQVTLPAEVEEAGGVTVPAKTFTELIGSLAQEKVTLESKDGVLQVVSKKTKSSFQTIPQEDFPKLFEEKGEKIA